LLKLLFGSLAELLVESLTGEFAGGAVFTTAAMDDVIR
jgi:hypothetical protein